MTDPTLQADCHETCGHIGTDCNFPVCKGQPTTVPLTYGVFNGHMDCLGCYHTWDEAQTKINEEMADRADCRESFRYPGLSLDDLYPLPYKVIPLGEVPRNRGEGE